MAIPHLATTKTLMLSYRNYQSIESSTNVDGDGNAAFAAFAVFASAGIPDWCSL
jgi:hypothetical protein